MEKKNSKIMALATAFTDEDRAVIEAVRPLVAAIGAVVGKHCEVLLHSLENPGRSVQAITNGHISGRGVGAPLYDKACGHLQSAYKGFGEPVCQYILSAKGQRLKNVTTAIFNKDKLIGYMCINMCLDAPLTDLTDSFRFAPVDPAQIISHYDWSFDAAIESSLRQAAQEIDTLPKCSAKQRNKQIITKLHELNVFKVRGSVEAVAARLDLSPNTVYLHLRQLKDKK